MRTTRQQTLKQRPFQIPPLPFFQRGRPSGPARSLRLDAHPDKIDEYMAKGIDKRLVDKLLDVAPNTLYAWLKVRRSGAASLRDAP